MTKALLPRMIANPNIGRTDQNSLENAYDVVSARKEKFVTPNGVKGKTLVFSRVNPEKISNNPGSAQGLEKATRFVESSIQRLKASPELKARMRSLLFAQVRGNITNSSERFISADGFHLANQNRFNLPEGKLVRFVDSANTEIPR